MAVSRSVAQGKNLALSDGKLYELRNMHNLSGLVLIPPRPADSGRLAQQQWLTGITRRLPPNKVSDVINKLIRGDYRSLARGNGDEYFYVYPLGAAGGGSILALSSIEHNLAFLDSVRQIILVLTLIAGSLIIVTYLLLSRTIFSPFRKMRRQAAQAGRSVVAADNEAEGMADDYERIISELKDKEARLIELNEQTRRRANSLEQFNQDLLRSMSSGIITFSRDGEALTVNHAGEKLLGVSSESIRGTDYRRLFDGNDDIIKSLTTVLKEREGQSYRETLLAIDDETRRNIGYSVSVVSDDCDQPIGASVIMTDLTELTQLRAELETQGRLAALGEMAGGLAHQLRNSLGAIAGFGTLIAKRMEPGAKDCPAASLIKETKEAESLVRRFLDFAKPLEIQPERMRLVALIDEVVGSFRIRGDCALFEFDTTGCSLPEIGELEIAADPLLLKQALANIVQNAVNAAVGDRGRVEISISVNAHGVVIDIADESGGIAKENLKSIFTPFYSSDPSGAGLGLPLAAKIVDLHGGSIAVHSELGKGTAFRITLPDSSQIMPEAVGAYTAQS
jgi:PAS domain S-box-containing protein